MPKGLTLRASLRQSNALILRDSDRGSTKKHRVMRCSGPSRLTRPEVIESKPVIAGIQFSNITIVLQSPFVIKSLEGYCDDIVSVSGQELILAEIITSVCS